MYRVVTLLAAALTLVCSGSHCSAQTYDVIQERNGLVNAFARLKARTPTTIAYFGGSITAGAGASDAGTTSWRALTTAWIRRQYPKTTVTEINASIGGTGSDLGAFRLKHDVLERHPDLIFVEFAVNDAGSQADLIQRSVEGIVRHIRSSDPTTEICFIYTLSREMLGDFKLGRLPSSIYQDEVIAEHYAVTSINVAAAAADQINARKLAWEDFSKDTCHPTDAGYSLYTDTITSYLAQQTQRVSRQPLPYRLAEPLNANCFEIGDVTPVDSASVKPGGWKVDQDGRISGWKVRLNSGAASGESASYTFNGPDLGVAFELGPDTGDFDYRIDAGEWRAVKPFDEFALNATRLQYRLLATDLKPGKHTVDIRPREEHDVRSKGSRTRLLFFMADAPARP